jgi:sporulation protein YlmC with PRC-barrel domain
MTSAAPLRLRLGDAIHCRDGVLGELADIVVDPHHCQVTHLVARGEGGLGSKRLIPYELVASAADGDGISLECTIAHARGLKQAEEVSYRPASEDDQGGPDWEVGVQDVFLVPRYDAGAFVDYTPEAEPEIMHMYDRIPKGHAEVRRESSVTTSDGRAAGTLVAVVVQEGRLTHLVVRLGHLWRRHSVMVPMAAVATLHTDDVILRSSNRELSKLPRCN